MRISVFVLRSSKRRGALCIKGWLWITVLILSWYSARLNLRSKWAEIVRALRDWTRVGAECANSGDVCRANLRHKLRRRRPPQFRREGWSDLHDRTKCAILIDQIYWFDQKLKDKSIYSPWPCLYLTATANPSPKHCKKQSAQSPSDRKIRRGP